MENCSRQMFATLRMLLEIEILKVNSMKSFTELISQFRDLIPASSNSTSPVNIIPTRLVKQFPDYYLALRKLPNLSLRVL